MDNRYRNRWMGLVALLLAAILAVGCAGEQPPGTEAAPTAGAAVAPLPEATATVTLTPSPPPALTPTGGDVQPTATRNPSLPDVPYEMTGFEIIAATVGDAYYSGYQCILTAAGCTCELPLVQQASFTFTPEGTLRYRFVGDGFAATWVMTRVGPNQWNYEIPILDDTGQVQGVAFSLLSFTEDGYIYTQGADLGPAGIVTCPDVNYRRLMSPTPTP